MSMGCMQVGLKRVGDSGQGTTFGKTAHITRKHRQQYSDTFAAQVTAGIAAGAAASDASANLGERSVPS